VNAPNEWNGARKVMMEAEYGRVSSRPIGDALIGNVGRNASVMMSSEKNGDARVNALEASSRNAVNHALKTVVEVQYTTVRFGVAG
jgi:hypothetical protein